MPGHQHSSASDSLAVADVARAQLDTAVSSSQYFTDAQKAAFLAG